MHRRLRPVAAFLLFGLVACSPSRNAGPGGAGAGEAFDPNRPAAKGGNGGGGVDAGAPAQVTADCEKMDILFVIDDSLSMDLEQENLVDNFPKFVAVLDDFVTDNGKSLDYRLGVTTTSVTTAYEIYSSGVLADSGSIMGEDGALRTGCEIASSYISSGDGDVAGKFSCLANVGVDGSGIEMPLRAVELAVSDRVADGTNAGFLRDDALLAVVILTDEDDCSHSTSPIKHTVPLFGSVPECMPNGLDEISHFVTTLNDIKGGPEKWAAAVIAGPAGAPVANRGSERPRRPIGFNLSWTPWATTRSSVRFVKATFPRVLPMRSTPSTWPAAPSSSSRSLQAQEG